jgi:hypothetical protein
MDPQETYVRRLPVKDEYSIALYICAHGTVLQDTPIPDSIRRALYWSSRNPVNGCSNTLTKEDMGQIEGLVDGYHQNRAAGLQSGRLHQSVLNDYCDAYQESHTIVNLLQLARYGLSKLFSLFIRVRKAAYEANSDGNLRRFLIDYNQLFIDDDMARLEARIDAMGMTDGGWREKMDLLRRHLNEIPADMRILKQYVSLPVTTETAVFSETIRRKLAEEIDDVLTSCYSLRALFDDQTQRFEPTMCNKFRRLKYEKTLLFKDARNEFQKLMGVYILDDTFPESGIPTNRVSKNPIQHRRILLHKLFSKPTLPPFPGLNNPITFSSIMAALLQLGYKRIYVYDTSCNYNACADYNCLPQYDRPFHLGPIDPLHRSLSSRKASASSAASGSNSRTRRNHHRGEHGNSSSSSQRNSHRSRDQDDQETQDDANDKPICHPRFGCFYR